MRKGGNRLEPRQLGVVGPVQLMATTKKTGKTSSRPLSLAAKKAFDQLEAEARAESDELSRLEVRLGVLPTEPETSLGARIQHTRSERGLTQGQLADLTKRADREGKGLSRAVISLYEAGTNKPGPREMRILCEVLRVTPSYLIYGGDDPFDTFHDRYRYGAIGGRHPEFVASLVFCFGKLGTHQKLTILEMMLALLRDRDHNFDLNMDQSANDYFLEMADELRSLLEHKRET